MRTFRYRCPRCHNPFAVEEIALGRPVGCPHCKEKIQIPLADSIHTLGSAAPSAGAGVSASEMDPEISADAREVAGNTAGMSPPSAATAPVHYDVNRKSLHPALSDPMAPVVPEATGLSFLIPEADPELATAKVLVEDRPKTIVYKGKVIELRRLSPEEKQRRRFRRRVILILTGALVLITYLLLKVGKF